jgi:hypothetical protein
MPKESTVEARFMRPTVEARFMTGEWWLDRVRYDRGSFSTPARTTLAHPEFDRKMLL